MAWHTNTPSIGALWNSMDGRNTTFSLFHFNLTQHSLKALKLNREQSSNEGFVESFRKYTGSRWWLFNWSCHQITPIIRDPYYICGRFDVFQTTFPNREFTWTKLKCWGEIPILINEIEFYFKSDDNLLSYRLI